ncbi:uncharacterized protein LOC62_01G001497 [Vanrija pseudolonga]|uniref:Uncharacterized protein n=1 Tax=Vanrija pseudolonga TaxID=143232 RepID=A0AAF0Y486_9TREE|nr:hypothetical protein LOC62_01G001497 [Vanrija pseudolonga]
MARTSSANVGVSASPLSVRAKLGTLSCGVDGGLASTVASLVLPPLHAVAYDACDASVALPHVAAVPALAADTADTALAVLATLRAERHEPSEAHLPVRQLRGLLPASLPLLPLASSSPPPSPSPTAPAPSSETVGMMLGGYAGNAPSPNALSARWRRMTLSSPRAGLYPYAGSVEIEWPESVRRRPYARRGRTASRSASDGMGMGSVRGDGAASSPAPHPPQQSSWSSPIAIARPTRRQRPLGRATCRVATSSGSRAAAAGGERGR